MKFELFDPLRNKFDSRIQLNSNFETKFDLELEFRIRYFKSNYELFSVEFEIRPSLVLRSDQLVICQKIHLSTLTNSMISNPVEVTQKG